jgi:SAM-dependent methyltransferase
LSKKHLKEATYDEIYGGTGYKEKKGPLAWLYKHLKRYERTRYQAVYNALEKGERLLDIGCGDGDFCIMSKDIFDDVYGVDVSPIRIMNAQKKISEREDKSNFHFVQHDVDENLIYPNGFFDAVTSLATLEYVVYPYRMIREARRVLKQGGHFIVQASNFAFLPHRLALLSGKLPAPGGIGECGVDWERLHNFTPEIVVKSLKQGGFEIVSVTCSGIFPRFRGIWPSLLAGDIIVKAKKPSVESDRSTSPSRLG